VFGAEQPEAFEIASESGSVAAVERAVETAAAQFVVAHEFGFAGTAECRGEDAHDRVTDASDRHAQARPFEASETHCVDLRFGDCVPVCNAERAEVSSPFFGFDAEPALRFGGFGF
jgi:hypothetical protein